MKKLSLKAKKTIIYIVTVALIVALITGVILSLGVVRAGASDIDIVANVVNDVEWQETPNATILPSNTNPAGTMQDAGSLTSDNRLYYNYEPIVDNMNRLLIPDFTVFWNGFDSSDTNNFGYTRLYLFVIVKNINPDNFSSSFYYQYKDTPSGYVQEVSQNFYVSDEYTIIGISWTNFFDDDTSEVAGVSYYNMRVNATNPQSARTDFVFGGYVLGYNLKETAQMAIDICDYKNEFDNPPSFVEGTYEFTTYDYSDTQDMLYANLTPVWDPFYAGFVGRVATADGTSVPVMYTWTIDGLNATNGNVVVLDPAYHDYITQLSLQSHVSNGSLELLIDKTMDVRYIAISDDLTLLSSDLIDQANKLQLIQDEINAAYNEGYLSGLEAGSKQSLAGVFGNAQMTVALYVYDPVTGVESPMIYNLPLNVANGGMDLSPIWKLWSESAFYDGDHVLSWIQVTISFDNGVLWSNDLLYFKFNTPLSANQLPYDAYLLTVENSSQNYNVSFVERNGLWYWQTSASLDGYSVSDISFKINNQHISYYNFLEGYNTTLNNNIQTFGTNQASYDRGYDDGYVDGVDDGYADGLDESSLTSWNEGHAAGFDEGRDVGYYAGYDDGLQDDFRFYDLFFSLFDAELNIWKSIVSFEIFGINVAGFVLGLVTIGVVAFVIRKVW